MASHSNARSITAWRDYLSGPDLQDRYGACHRHKTAAYTRQRDLIRRIFEATRPKSVACLGAGVLNDIPYLSFLRGGATVHMVDWLPGATDTGIALSIISKDRAGAPVCAYCAIGDAVARTCCRNFGGVSSAGTWVCENFSPAVAEQPVCEAYRRGDWPAVHLRDVTGGYATAFAEGLIDELSGATSWKQAFGRAKDLAKRLSRAKRPGSGLDIPDGSVDFVTSAMVMSQFEHEPYGYFSSQAAKVLGPPDARDQIRLRHGLKDLRDVLLANQFEGHCAEIRRILAPGGRCFMSFELFHFNADDDQWFLVKEMNALLPRLERHFRFSFEGIPDRDYLMRLEPRESDSLVLSFLLEPK
jgi:hypothetical protein